ncbi:hypothetical protein ABT124_49235 [Streptomyces sp. NPDC001982]|uniref:hypothetical protein n=1 Tax=unclassified Streptomyces TaxID=2593676 RepID=UPI0033183C13
MGGTTPAWFVSESLDISGHPAANLPVPWADCDSTRACTEGLAKADSHQGAPYQPTGNFWPAAAPPRGGPDRHPPTDAQPNGKPDHYRTS